MIKVGKRFADKIIENNNYEVELVNIEYKRVFFNKVEYHSLGSDYMTFEHVFNKYFNNGRNKGINVHESIENLFTDEYKPTYDVLFNKKYSHEEELYKNVLNKKLESLIVKDELHEQYLKDDDLKSPKVINQCDNGHYEDLFVHMTKTIKENVDLEDKDIDTVINTLKETMEIHEYDFLFFLFTDKDTGEQGLLSFRDIIKNEDDHADVIKKYLYKNKDTDIIQDEFIVTKSYQFNEVIFNKQVFNMAYIRGDYTNNYITEHDTISVYGESDYTLSRTRNNIFELEYGNPFYRVSEVDNISYLSTLNFLLIKRLINVDDKNNITFTNMLKTNVLNTKLNKENTLQKIGRPLSQVMVTSNNSKSSSVTSLDMILRVIDYVHVINLNLITKKKNTKPFVDIKLKKPTNEFTKHNSRLIKQLSIVGDPNYVFYHENLDEMYLKSEEDKIELEQKRQEMFEKYKDTKDDVRFNVLMVNYDNASQDIESKVILGSNDEILKLIYSNTFHKLYPQGENFTCHVKFLNNNLMTITIAKHRDYVNDTSKLAKLDVHVAFVNEYDGQNLFNYTYDKILDTYDLPIHELHSTLKEKNDYPHEYFTNTCRIDSRQYTDTLIFRNDLLLVFDNGVYNISEFLSFTHLLEFLSKKTNKLLRNKVNTSVDLKSLGTLRKNAYGNNTEENTCGSDRERAMIEHKEIRKILENV